MRIARRLSDWFREHLGIILILALAAVVWLAFPVGILAADGLAISEAGWEAARPIGLGLSRELGVRQVYSQVVGLLEEDNQPSPILVLPTAIAYAVASVSNWTTFLLPFTASLMNVLLVYAIGKKIGGKQAGNVAALLWAFLPPESFHATLLAPNSLQSTVLLVALAAQFFIAGKNPSVADYLATALLGIAAWYAIDSTHSVTEGSSAAQTIARQEEWLILLPAWFVCARLQTSNPDRLSARLLGKNWLTGILLLSGWLASTGPTDVLPSPFSSIIYLYPVLAIAMTIGPFLELAQSRSATLIGVGLLLLSVWMTAAPSELAVPSFHNGEWLWRGGVGAVLRILVGLGLLTILAFAYVAGEKDSKWRKLLARCTVATILVASLISIDQNSAGYRADALRWREGLQWAQFHHQEDNTIWVTQGIQFRWLRQMAGFVWNRDDGNDLAPVAILRDGEAPQAGDYVLVSEEQIAGQPIPPDWVRNTVLGAVGQPQLVIYSVEPAPADVTCASILQEAKSRSLSSLAFLFLPESGNCEYSGGPNLVESLIDIQNAYSGSYLRIVHDRDGGDLIGHKYFLYPDGRTFDFQVLLEPNAIYYFAITVQMQEPATLLYLRVGETELSFGSVLSRTPATFGVLVLTPEWETHLANVSPLLIPNYGAVRVSDFELVKISP